MFNCCRGPAAELAKGLCLCHKQRQPRSCSGAAVEPDAGIVPPGDASCPVLPLEKGSTTIHSASSWSSCINLVESTCCSRLCHESLGRISNGGCKLICIVMVVSLSLISVNLPDFFLAGQASRRCMRPAV